MYLDRVFLLDDDQSALTLHSGFQGFFSYAHEEERQHASEAGQTTWR